MVTSHCRHLTVLYIIIVKLYSSTHVNNALLNLVKHKLELLLDKLPLLEPNYLSVVTKSVTNICCESNCSVSLWLSVTRAAYKVGRMKTRWQCKQCLTFTESSVESAALLSFIVSSAVWQTVHTLCCCQCRFQLQQLVVKKSLINPNWTCSVDV